MQLNHAIQSLTCSQSSVHLECCNQHPSYEHCALEYIDNISMSRWIQRGSTECMYDTLGRVESLTISCNVDQPIGTVT